MGPADDHVHTLPHRTGAEERFILKEKLDTNVIKVNGRGADEIWTKPRQVQIQYSPTTYWDRLLGENQWIQDKEDTDVLSWLSEQKTFFICGLYGIRRHCIDDPLLGCDSFSFNSLNNV